MNPCLPSVLLFAEGYHTSGRAPGAWKKSLRSFSSPRRNALRTRCLFLAPRRLGGERGNSPLIDIHPWEMGKKRRYLGNTCRDLLQSGEQQTRLVCQVQGARKVTACHGLVGLGKEGTRIFKRLLVVGGKVRATQFLQAPADVLLQTQELAPEFVLLGGTLAWFEGGDFCGRGFRSFGIFRRGGFILVGGRSGCAGCFALWWAVGSGVWGGGVSSGSGSGSGGGAGSSITKTRSEERRVGKECRSRR